MRARLASLLSSLLFSSLLWLLSDDVRCQAGGIWEPTSGFNHQISGVEAAPPPTGFNPANWPTRNGAPTLNALHACLIPEGLHRGQVLVWDGNTGLVRAFQHWSIVNPKWDPANPVGYRFHNGLLAMPLDPSGQPLGELFCGGQCWLPDGRLFVAGGTRAFANPTTNGWIGSSLVYQFDPATLQNPPTAQNPFGTWHRMQGADLFMPRWYPTLIYDGTTDWRVLVLGGITDLSPPPGPGTGTDPLDHYESYRVAYGAQIPSAVVEQKPSGPNPRLYDGPAIVPGNPNGNPPTLDRGLTEYPRVHLLTTGGFFLSGEFTVSRSWLHGPGNDPTYSATSGQIPPGYHSSVDDATSVLFPNFGGVHNRVVRIGGRRQPGFLLSNWVEVSYATTPGDVWTTGPTGLPSMNWERYRGNVVILPNGQLFAVGGDRTNPNDPPNPIPNDVPELLFNASQWVDMAPHTGSRAYHSCAILLPDGRVFVSGGEGRGPDYQIWRPPYMTNGLTRPVVSSVTKPTGGYVDQNARDQMTYNQGPFQVEWSNVMPFGVAVEKVVLMRPSALTHHDDGGQRYVELTSWTDTVNEMPGRLFNSPLTRFHAPPGWYMLFVVTNQGVPSEAFWVHLR